MKNEFDELAEELVSVENWLALFMTQPIGRQQQELAESLQRYLRHCRRDKRKWRSEAAARNARRKIKLAWYTLYVSREQKP